MTEAELIEAIRQTKPDARGARRARGYNAEKPSERYDAVLDEHGLRVIRFFAPEGEGDELPFSAIPKSVGWDVTPADL